MSGPRIVLQSCHQEALQEAFRTASPNENAGIVLFRRIDREAGILPESPRYVSVDVTILEPDWLLEQTPTSITFHTAPLRQFMQRCEDEDLVLGFAHNHPGGYPHFSKIDDENEVTLLTALANRNGPSAEILALLWAGDHWLARVRNASEPVAVQPARHVTALGDLLELYLPHESMKLSSELSARQAAAFGLPFAAGLASLRVAIVGCGGTGSPTATLLARSGVGEIILIDPDVLEESNLNRVRGAFKRDLGKNKARIMAEFINDIGTRSTAIAIESALDQSTVAVEALSSADIIFGCTDDYAGREVLNKAAYVYCQPLIDVGLGGTVALDKSDNAILRNHFARISLVMPHDGPCLFCQGAVTSDLVQHQLMMRADPERAAAEVEEGYLQGGGEQAPGVGPFTGAAAAMGVTTLYDLIRGFRKLPGHLNRSQIIMNFVTMEFESRQADSEPECPYCGTHEFLVAREVDGLLGRPGLGS